VSVVRPPTEDFGARLSFDRSAPGRRAVDVPSWDGEETPLPDAHLLRDSVTLPELSQGGLVRYYTALSARNYGIDSGTYPLGSCTMKYNPKVDDLVASLPGFATAHPQAPVEDAQGTLRILLELRRGLAEVTGLPAVSLAPAAGAQGELAGVLMITRALEDRGELDGEVVECEYHGSQFDVTTGGVVNGPAVLPVQQFAVKVEGDDILVGPA